MAGFDISELLKRLLGGDQQAPSGLLNPTPVAQQAMPQPGAAQTAPAQGQPEQGFDLLGGAKSFFQPDPDKREALDAGLLRMGAAMLAGGGPSKDPTNFAAVLGQGIGSGQQAYQDYRKDASEMGLASNKVRSDGAKMLLGQQAAQAVSGENVGEGPLDPETGYSMNQLRQLHQAYLSAGELSAANNILDKIQRLQQSAAEKGMSVGPDGQFADANGFNAGLAAQETAKTTAQEQAKVPFNKTPDTIEYDLYVKQENEAGRTPLDFTPWSRENKKAGASSQSVTVGGTKADDEFAKESAKEQAKAFGAVAADYGVAKQDLASIGELRFALKDNPGGFVSGIKSYASTQFGIKLGDDAGNIEYANAMINKLIPQQRPAGSGSMSDRDVEMFKQSLPNLMNTPAGNALVMNTMEGMANYRVAMAEIAQKSQIGPPQGISRQEAIAQMNALPDPLAEYRAQREAQNEGPAVLGGGKGNRSGAVNSGSAGVPKVGMKMQDDKGVIREFVGGNPRDPNNWKPLL